MPVVLISRSLAARHWAGGSPIGDQVRLAGLGDTEARRTIVGVVSDIPYGNPLSRERSTDAIYVALQQSDATAAQVIVRARVSEVAGRQALHQVLGAVDPQLRPGYVYRAEEVIQKSGLMTAGLAKLFGSCFAFALLLAVAGIYGLMSRSIGLRTREIGLRRALGASEGVATRMLLVQAVRQMGVGTLMAAPILVIVGVAATQLLPLSGAVTATSGIGVCAAIVAVVIAATWMPASKVMRVPLRDALGRE